MLIIIFLLVGGLLAAAPPLVVLPPSVELSGAADTHQLLAEAAVDEHQEDWTRTAHWTSSNPAVARVDQTGLVTPATDGSATITATASGRTATASVRVRGAGAPSAWRFRNDVIPVLTKMGCNSGACHGALAGKNGFKLTLRGYAPEVDYDTLTRQAVGRRVNLADPPSSLMLLKPTFAIPHGGGKRFSTSMLEYKILSEWIAAGAPPPSAKDAEVTGLEVYPAAATLQTGSEQQLVVRSKYSD